MNARHRGYRDARKGAPPTRHSAARASSPDRKWCPGCQRELARAEFGSNRSAADGLTSYCKPCHNEKGKQTAERLYGGTRAYHLRRRYGITAADYDALVAAQGGVCALCRERFPKHVDHDHVTHRVRGALCSGCNQGLGNFHDDAHALRLAADYVERHSWQRWRTAPGVLRMVPPRTQPVVEKPDEAPARAARVEALVAGRR